MGLYFPDLIDAAKQIVTPPKWKERDSVRVEFASAVMTDGVVPEGFELRGGALINRPDRGVTFNLQIHPSNAPCVSLARIEWNPFRPRTNPLTGPKALCGMIISGSHIHHFEDNWLPDLHRMRQKNLPFARPIDVNPATFEDLLVLAQETLRIDGLIALESPAWTEGSLFGG